MQKNMQMKWLILQQKKPDDFVVATEKNYSIKYFISLCCKILNLEIKWVGKGINEKAILKNFDKKKYQNLKKNQIIIKINKDILDLTKLILWLVMQIKQKKF